MGIGIILLIIGCLLLSISSVGGGILFGCGAIIFVWGASTWMIGKFKGAGYTKKSGTARKRGIVQVVVGLLVLFIGGLVNWALSGTGWVWGGIIIVGLLFVITGLYRLLSGRG